MFLTAATIFLAAFGSVGATDTAAAPVIREGAVQQVDVEAPEADLRLRGSIPFLEGDGDDDNKDNLHQDAAMALSLADANEEPQDYDYADGLGTSYDMTKYYLSPYDLGPRQLTVAYACSVNDCSDIKIESAEYKEANPEKCQWRRGGDDSIVNIGCYPKVIDVSGGKCEDDQEIVLYEHHSGQNQKWEWERIGTTYGSRVYRFKSKLGSWLQPCGLTLKWHVWRGNAPYYNEGDKLHLGDWNNVWYATRCK